MKTLPLLVTAGMVAFSVVRIANAGSCCSTNVAPACCTKNANVAPEKFTERSLYQVESTWNNDADKSIPLSALAGRPQVVAMFFARCQFTCPVTVHDLQRIEAALPAALKDKVGFTLVSFDSQRDTAAVLAKYRQTHQFGTNWTLLRGQGDDVLELSALLGVNFKQDAQGDFSHSNLITILNARGEVVYRLVGLKQDITEAVNKLTELTATSANTLAGTPALKSANDRE